GAAAMGRERDRWTTHSSGAEQQIETLKTRLVDTERELDGFADVPAMIEEKRDKLMSALAEAERERQVTADVLAAADTELRAGVQALRAAQGAVAEARE